jgi:PPOX class probable F420-dependent enzyme
MVSEAQIETVQRLAAADHGLAVVSTLRPEGSIHSSVVNAGVLEHPVTTHPVVVFVARGDSLKLKHLRERPLATVVFRSGWQWIGVDGNASLAGPNDQADGMLPSEIPQVLRNIFTAAGGQHDDWEEYDRVMAAEGRTAVFVEMDRVYPS